MHKKNHKCNKMLILILVLFIYVTFKVYVIKTCSFKDDAIQSLLIQLLVSSS